MGVLSIDLSTIGEILQELVSHRQMITACEAGPDNASVHLVDAKAGRQRETFKVSVWALKMSHTGDLGYSPFRVPRQRQPQCQRVTLCRCCVTLMHLG